MVKELFITDVRSAPMVAMESVEAIAGRGLLGDRYYLGTGYYSGRKGWGANVSLVQSEAIAAINAGHGQNITGQQLRRNIVTADISLDALVGRTFRCGTAVLRGIKRYPPCSHLARLMGLNEVIRYLANCGGMGAEVINDGIIRIGDDIHLD